MLFQYIFVWGFFYQILSIVWIICQFFLVTYLMKYTCWHQKMVSQYFFSFLERMLQSFKIYISNFLRVRKPTLILYTHIPHNACSCLHKHYYPILEYMLPYLVEVWCGRSFEGFFNFYLVFKIFIWKLRTLRNLCEASISLSVSLSFSFFPFNHLSKREQENLFYHPNLNLSVNLIALVKNRKRLTWLTFETRIVKSISISSG